MQVGACIPLGVELSNFFPHPGFPGDEKPHCVVFVVSESGRARHMCSARRAVCAGPLVLGHVSPPWACARATSTGVSDPLGDAFPRHVCPSACKWLSQKRTILFCHKGN